MKDNDVFITTKDYSVTGESFELIYNEKYLALKTFPQPNPQEIMRYYESSDYISHTDGKRNLFEKAYHMVKSFSIKRKLNLINKFQGIPGTILDFGCGTGDFLSYMKINNWNSYGYEPNEKARELAKRKGLRLIENLNEIENHFFDVITLWHVFEHLDNPEEYLKSLKKLLKPKGTLIIAVPNYESYDASYYGKYWAAFDVPRHLWHYSKKSFQILAESHNMKVKKILPMYFDGFYVSLLSEKYKTGKMKPMKSFWIGLKSNFYGMQKNNFSSHIYIIQNN